jgi:hypothetical protein
MPDSKAEEVYHFDSTGENLRKFIPLDSDVTPPSPPSLSLLRI